MKRYLLTLSFVFMALLASAVEMPDKRHTLELTLGDYFPHRFTTMWYDCSCGPAGEEGYDGERHYILLPTFNLTYHYAAKPWLEVGATLGSTAYLGRYYKAAPMNTVEEVLFGNRQTYLLADVRFTYFRRELITLYSGIGLGMELDYHDVSHEPLGTRKLTCLPAAQLTAFGFQLGRKRAYWSFEAGFGMKGIVNTGIGFRF